MKLFYARHLGPMREHSCIPRLRQASTHHESPPPPSESLPYTRGNQECPQIACSDADDKGSPRNKSGGIGECEGC